MKGLLSSPGDGKNLTPKVTGKQGASGDYCKGFNFRPYVVMLGTELVVPNKLIK